MPVMKLPKPNAPPVAAACFQLVVCVSCANSHANTTSCSQPPCGVGANVSVFAAPARSAAG
ncbi:Uncharacterised protein [Burkholderia pseudomallei]|nr:hypothetical protein DO70_4612 [Burkholderia pseudomallei]CAJ3171638.1 Uncharacterised protein [Burkholderia pseudomallei]CAJ3622344.1 Uncharacterised protein [Burkholderia pseudomallei]CAJ3938747.1 Uncharacterised protein [Burkholderia pseudomallei]CAJ3941727.1 Uncharacterised protein [Burkholderia pseudomallei]